MTDDLADLQSIARLARAMNAAYQAKCAAWRRRDEVEAGRHWRAEQDTKHALFSLLDAIQARASAAGCGPVKRAAGSGQAARGHQRKR